MKMFEHHIDYTGPYLSGIFLFDVFMVLNNIYFAGYVDNATTDCNKPTVYVVTIIDRFYCSNIPMFLRQTNWGKLLIFSN